jgi:peptide deformylase
MSDLICDLVKEDDPFLREVPNVFDFDSPQVDPEKLEKQLMENMFHHNGFGLSANQIGIPVTAFAMMVGNDPLVVFNPEIIEWSKETTYIKEGCLSYPGLFVAIERAYGVSTRFQLASGEEQSGNFIDIPAKTFQHESEHMDGEIFIDKVSGFKLKSAMRKRNIYLRKLNKQKKE